MGIHHCHCVGQLGFAFVVIRHHKIDAQFPAEIRLFNGGDAAVHGDDQIHILFLQHPNGGNVQAVAFLQPGGDIPDTVCPLFAEKIRQKTGGGDAVHIIVAVNSDGLLFFNGLTNPLRGLRHIGKSHGIQQAALSGSKKCPRFFGGVITPCHQHRSGQRGNSCGDQLVCFCLIQCRYVPCTVLQNRYTSKQ